MKKSILIPPALFSQQCPEAISKLKEKGFNVIQNEYGLPFNWDKYSSEMEDIVAVIAGVEHWTKQRLLSCPNLKIIARYGVGIDNFDLEAATNLKIKIVNAKGLNSYSVAEHTFGLILNLTRRITQFNSELHDGMWEKYSTINLKGKTLGLLGFGSIARLVSSFAKTFGMKVLAYDIFADKEIAKSFDIKFVSFQEVLANSDIVSVHLPGNANTYHLLNAEAFNLMKKDSYFINTSRGSVVDEKALYEAIVEGRLKAAASDVFEDEPVDIKNPLLSLANFIATPHVAAITKDTNKDVGICNAQQIIDFFEGKEPLNSLN